ncbi:MAG TPA: magnesium-translocating P-type ATPase [Rhizomicrobium sp.]|nr:magnesium-translocating P-type ATPase [Rhizomicrobium sp.]
MDTVPGEKALSEPPPSGPALGLTTEEAARRLVWYGPNRIQGKPRVHLLVQFLRRFANPLTLVLLGAALVSAIIGERSSFIIIICIVLLSVTLDFFQERRAGKAVEALQQRVALKVQVYRNGRLIEIAATDIVPEDVIALAAGDLVPADCDLLEARDLFVNEALLTGEAFPAEKHAGAGAASGQSSIPTNAICMGSSVISGTAIALVRRTGRATQLGAIAGSLRVEPETAFTIGIRRFGYLIIRLTILLVLFVILVNLLFHRPVVESFFFALALAVGLTPELLPMIMSVTLAHGAIRLAEKQVIVKRPSAIHDLGSMDVLCCDKTGTLTEAKIELVRAVGIDGAENPHALRLARINAAFETGLKSPLDLAILQGGARDADAYRKIDEVPFDFERRRVSVLVETERARFLIVKGAPEDVLLLSSRYESGGGIAELDGGNRSKAASLLVDFGKEGLRALGVAWREVEADREHAGITDETNLIFAGFALFLDPPKESAKAALDALEALGVTVKIITGDNEHIARHVCESLGMPVLGLLMGAEIDHLPDEALPPRVENANLFCRVTPMQKARIIRALRRRGHVVGYLGDGINDAPSINAADAGISVDSAVDVAKGAASLVLLQKDLGVLVDGVKEGRRTFANILKYIVMGTSSNFGNMFSMAGAVLILPFLPMLPIQILLNNLLYDISEIAIPLDRVDDEFIARPHRWNMQFVRNVMLILGPISSLFDFMTFGILLQVFRASEVTFHTAWFLESLMTQVLVIFIIRTTGSPVRSRPAPLLTATCLTVLAAALVLPYTPPGAWFGFVPLAPRLLLSLLAITCCYLLAVQAVKYGLRRWLVSA